MNIGQIVCSFHDANSSDENIGFQTKQNITVGFHANEVSLGNDKIITIDAGIALAPQDNDPKTEENFVFVKDQTCGFVDADIVSSTVLLHDHRRCFTSADLVFLFEAEQLFGTV